MKAPALRKSAARWKIRSIQPNVASQRVLEKCNYQRQGLMRNAVIKNAEVLDAYVYAIMR
jgi:RimJ/RimL family protein N-acetyltransferase